MEDKVFKNYQEAMRNQPLQYVKAKSKLEELQERWTSLIRGHGFDIVKREGDNKMTNPDLFSIANEIDAFFAGLSSK